jgi:membrane associated rhomboid family serine protease
VFPLRDNVYRTHDPVVVWALIASNVVAFAYELMLDQRQLEAYIAQHGLIPARYFVQSWALRVGLSPLDFTPFLSNTFLHGSFLHIIMNMWTLWIFGPALEDRLGPVRFAVLYLASGILASCTHAVFNATSTLPVLGASGAIAGVLGAYAIRFPFAWIRVLVLIVVIPIFFNVPAIVFAGHDRAVLTLRGQRHRLVGPYRRVRVGLGAAARPRAPRCAGRALSRRPMGGLTSLPPETRR